MLSPLTWNADQQANRDGTFTAHVHGKWVNYHDGTQFQKIDLTPVPYAGGFRMEKAPYSFDFPETADKGFRFVSTNPYDIATKSVRNDAPLGITKQWTGALPVKGVVTDDGVLYEGALPDGDILLQPHEQELRYFVVFNKPPSGTGDVVIPFTLTLDEALDIKKRDGKSIDDKNVDIASGASVSRNTFRSISFKPATVWDSGIPKRKREQIKIMAKVSGGKIVAQKIIPRSFFDSATYPVYTDMSTTLFYPAGDYSDGVVGAPYSSSWAVTVGAAGSKAFLTDDPPNAIYYGRTAGVWDEIDRFIACFDITAITSANAVSVGSFFGYIGTINDNGSQSVYLDLVAPTNPASLAAGDYSKFSSVEQATAHPTLASLSAGYKEFALNTTGIANANLKVSTGYFCLGLRGSGDFLNSEPSMSNGQYALVRVYDSHHTGTDHDPYVSLTYAAAAAGPANLGTWNGLAKASIGTINGVTLANTKTINGLA